MFELMKCFVCGREWNKWDIKYPDSNNTAVDYQGSTCPRCGTTGYSLSPNKPLKNRPGPPAA